MALPPLAAVSDLAAWVGRDIPDADPRAGAVLSAASAIVRSEVDQTWVDDQGALTEVPDDVAVVVVQVAARVWLNPSGLESLTIDDATRRWSSSGPLGLHLTDSERAILAKYRTVGQPRGIGVLSTTRGDDYGRTLYVPTAPEPSGYPFPWYDSQEMWP